MRTGTCLTRAITRQAGWGTGERQRRIVSWDRVVREGEACRGRRRGSREGWAIRWTSLTGVRPQETSSVDQKPYWLAFVWAIAACSAGRIAPGPSTGWMGCGNEKLGRTAAVAAPRHLFAGDEYAAKFRQRFYPGVQPGDSIAAVADPRECARVLSAFQAQVPRIAGLLSSTPGPRNEGRHFALLRIGPYYHVTTSRISLDCPDSVPGQVCIIIDHSASSFVADRSTLLFDPLGHSQF